MSGRRGGRADVRGSSGYGQELPRLDNGKQREDSVADIGALPMDRQPDRLDTGLVAVYGGSYGGSMVLAALARYGYRPARGVDWSASRFVTFRRRTSRIAGIYGVRSMATSGIRPCRNLEAISPTTNAARSRHRLLVARAKRSARPAFEADKIVATARKERNAAGTFLQVTKDRISEEGQPRHFWRQ